MTSTGVDFGRAPALYLRATLQAVLASDERRQSAAAKA